MGGVEQQGRLTQAEAGWGPPCIYLMAAQIIGNESKCNWVSYNSYHHWCHICAAIKIKQVRHQFASDRQSAICHH